MKDRENQIYQLRKQARTVLKQKVQFYADVLDVTYGSIAIRHQVSRWGSCSSKGNLSFNCLLLLAPESIQDYVVVHELAHRKHMNHSPDFWHEVETVLPDYKNAIRWLKTSGLTMIQKMGPDD